MCPPKTPKVENPAASPAPAAQGADSLVLGGGSLDPQDPATRQGLIGRALLRLRGKGSTAGAASGVSAGSGPGGLNSPGLPSGLAIGGSAGGGSRGTDYGVGTGGSTGGSSLRLGSSLKGVEA